MRPWRFIAVVGIMFGVAVNAAQVGLIKINGAIGPASASYIARAVGIAAEQHDECLIIQLDTPGGLVDSASQIVEKFYAAKVPTVVYVSPAPAIHKTPWALSRRRISRRFARRNPPDRLACQAG